MENVYIVFRGNDGEEPEFVSVHGNILSARAEVDSFLSACAKEGFTYKVPESIKNEKLRAWYCGNAYVKIETHKVI